MTKGMKEPKTVLMKKRGPLKINVYKSDVSVVNETIGELDVSEESLM